MERCWNATRGVQEAGASVLVPAAGHSVPIEGHSSLRTAPVTKVVTGSTRPEETADESVETMAFSVYLWCVPEHVRSGACRSSGSWAQPRLGGGARLLERGYREP